MMFQHHDPNDFEGSVDGTIWPGLIGIKFMHRKKTEVEVVEFSPLDGALTTGREFRFACVQNQAHYGETGLGSRPEPVSAIRVKRVQRDPDALARLAGKPKRTDQGWEKAKREALLPWRGRA